MGKKYKAWILVQIPVEFEDNEDLDLVDQAYDALPILPNGAEPEAVYDLTAIED